MVDRILRTAEQKMIVSSRLVCPGRKKKDIKRRKRIKSSTSYLAWMWSRLTKFNYSRLHAWRCNGCSQCTIAFAMTKRKYANGRNWIPFEFLILISYNGAAQLFLIKLRECFHRYNLFLFIARINIYLNYFALQTISSIYILIRHYRYFWILLLIVLKLQSRTNIYHFLFEQIHQFLCVFFFIFNSFPSFILTFLSLHKFTYNWYYHTRMEWKIPYIWIFHEIHKFNSKLIKLAEHESIIFIGEKKIEMKVNKKNSQ